jgi:hypothetical protein
MEKPLVRTVVICGLAFAQVENGLQCRTRKWGLHFDLPDPLLTLKLSTPGPRDLLAINSFRLAHGKRNSEGDWLSRQSI